MNFKNASAVENLTRYQRWWRRHATEDPAFLAKHREKMRKAYLANKDKFSKRNAEWRKNNPETANRLWSEYRVNNLEARLENCRKWHNAHKDTPEYKLEHSKRGKRNWAENKHLISKRHKAWNKANPGKLHAYRHHRDSLEKAARVGNQKLISDWIHYIRSKPTFRCYYCDRLFPSSKVQMDHILPLNKGGAHSIENLCTSCKKCNSEKRDTLIVAWYKLGQQVMSL